MPKWLTDDQGSGEWFKSRLGCLTASRMVDAMATLKKGGESEARRKLKLQLIAERLSGNATEFFVTAAMQRGTDCEPEAKAKFEEVKGLFIQDCGFALHDEIEWCGASPDGLVGTDALIEIKNPNSETHLAYKLAGVPPPQYVPQMLLQLAVTKRRLCYFMSYDNRLPDPHNTFIVEFEPTPEEIAAVENSAAAFLQEVEAMQRQLTTEEVAIEEQAA